MTGSLITDEIVTKAARAQWDALRDRVGGDDVPSVFEDLNPESQALWIADIRVGLEAVVGDIIEAFGASGKGAATG